MKYLYRYSNKALDDLEDLNQKDSRRIIKKLDNIFKSSNPITQAKPLKGKFIGLYRFRIGDYRAIFSKDNKGNITIITVITIAHRKNIYK